MSTRQIATSTLWQMGSQIVMAALSIVTTKFVAIGLSQELAGNYNTAYGYLQLFGILADFGLYAVAVREVSKAADKERVLGALLFLRSIILALSLGTALLFIWLLPTWKGTPLPMSVTIASLVPLFTLLAGIIRTAFQVHYKLHYVFIAEVTQRIITVSLIGILVYLGARNSTDVSHLYSFLAVGGIGAFVLFLLSFIFGSRLIRIRMNTDRQELMHLLKQASPYGIAFLCTALYRQFDVTLIALLRPDFELQNAYYGFVQRMMDMAYLLPTFLLNSTLPALTEREATGQETKHFLGKIFIIILLIGSVSFLFAFFWSRPLMQLLTTDRYLSTLTSPGSDTALHLLAFSMFFNGIVLFCFYSLLTKHAWKPLVVTLSIGVVTSLLSNLLLIPGNGFVGASWTSVITHSLLVCLLLPYTARILPFHISGKQWREWILFTVLLGVPLYFVAPYLNKEIFTAVALGLMGLWMLACVKLTGLDRALRGN
jgi:O-antigen/teichoic acid export membrane protein